MVTSVDVELNLDGDVKTTKKKISWLAASETSLVPVNFFSFHHLMPKDKLDKGDDLEEFLVPVTMSTTAAFTDCNVTALAKGAIVQVERKGYYRLDCHTVVQGREWSFSMCLRGNRDSEGQWYLVGPVSNSFNVLVAIIIAFGVRPLPVVFA